MSGYPALTSDKLLPFKLVLQRLKDDPNYLDLEACPYTQEVRAWLKKNLGQAGVAAAVADVELAGEPIDLDDPESWSDVAQKAMATYAKLERLEGELGQGDVGDQINIIKSQAAMLERVISIREKALGHREVAEFKRIVLSAVDDIMTPDQRTELMSRLGGG